MKKSLVIVAFTGISLISIHGTNAQVNLGKIKDKVKDKTKNNGSSSSSDNGSSNNNGSSSTGSSVNTSGIKDPYQLYEMGNKEFDAKNWKAAKEYYEAAQNNGYNDGEMRMKMNECDRQLSGQAARDDEQVKEMEKQIEAMREAQYKMPLDQDEGVTSTTHQKYMNKIVFSKSEIVKKSENEASFTNTFTLADNIYGRIYNNQSNSNYANNIGHIWNSSDFIFRISIEGAPQNEFLLKDWAGGMGMNKEDHKTWTTFQLGVSPNKSQVNEYPQAPINIFYENLYHLPEGTYKVKVEYVFDVPADQQKTSATVGEPMIWTTKFGPEQMMASGEFTINIKNSDKLAYATKVSKPMPTPSRKDAALEQSMIKATTGKWEGQTPVKAIIIGDDWVYLRDVWGVITGRTIEAAIIMKYDNGMYKVYDSRFYQQNQGGEKYGVTTYDGEMNGGKIGQWWIAKEFVK